MWQNCPTFNIQFPLTFPAYCSYVFTFTVTITAFEWQLASFRSFEAQSM